MIVSFMNPFKVLMKPDFESVGVNIIEMPPLGSPELIQPDKMPEISIPEAMVEEEIAVPIATPETREEPVEIEKPPEEKVEEKSKTERDTGYKDQATTADKNQEGGADVSEQIGPGSAFGSAFVDNASFNYPTYFLRAFGKIQRAWSNPVRANKPLSCFIYFQVLRSGTIFDPVIKQSSGVEAYDRSCMRALQAANPLPPLPSEFQDDIIGITLEFPFLPR
ncbi:MAG: TonB family protein [candidate division Zixibacteria bacterium]